MKLRTRIPGQTAVLASGTILQFGASGELDTDDLPESKRAEAIAFLEPLVDVPGTGFYSEKPVVAAAEVAAQNDVTTAAQIALDKVAAAQRAAVGG